MQRTWPSGAVCQLAAANFGANFGVSSFSFAPNEWLIPNTPRNDELTSSIPRPG